MFLSIALWLTALAATPAAAMSVDVRDRLCASVVTETVPSDDVAALPYDCARAAAGYRDRWIWLKIDDRAALRALPPQFTLLVDQARFSEIRAVATLSNGRAAARIGLPGHLGRNWAPGGHLRFDFVTGDARVTGLYIGFDRLDHLPTVRKVRLISHDALDAQTRNWLLLMGVFAGTLASSVLFATALQSGLGVRLRRIYAAWAGCSLVYGLCWSNIMFYAVPGLAGPWGVRLNSVLLGATIGLGLLFFIAFLERSALPASYRRAIERLAWASMAAGALASADVLGMSGVSDGIFVLTVLAGVIAVAAGIGIALLNGSRAARFYLLAWAAPIVVVLLRIARGLDLLPQADIVDYATFGSMAVQAVLLSVGIGDRFRAMQIERDLASSERDSAAAERESMRRLAETDTLTGVFNRRGFMQRAQAMIGRHGALALVDLDNFKTINDGFGHDIGDAVLTRIAGVLQAVTGEAGLAGRLGGEEFALIGPLEAGESARAAVEAIDFGDLLGPGRTVTISAGVATGAPLYEQLYVAADRALYRAKQDGRNRVVVSGVTDRVRAIS